MADGHGQHGCHGTLHDEHPSTLEVCPPAKAWPNVGAARTSYFTPRTDPSAGSARDLSNAPKLFQPLQMKGITMQNRIMVSPMCQYSAEDGHMTMWHYTHLGGILQRGPGLTIIEATAISPEGRITPEDLGLWKDSQMEALTKVIEFAHSQNQMIGVQLAHAGRKASTVAPWVNRKAIAVGEVHGWPNNVKSVTGKPFSNDTCVPHEMTVGDIEKFKTDWVAALQRAVKAGVDCVEIHAAHGYLLNCFLSPATNTRTDKYGGSFENRVRLFLEIVDLSRANMPVNMPLLARVSGSDWLEYDPSIRGWDIPQTVELAKILDKMGLDLLDITTGGVSSKQKIVSGPGYQVPCSLAIKKALPNTKMIIAVVGMITEGRQAQNILDDGAADVVTVGRQFLKDPGLVWRWAEELDVNIYLASQIGWGFGITKDHLPTKPAKNF